MGKQRRTSRNLYRLSESELGKYIATLNSLGYNLNNKNISNTIHIDKQGYSEEIKDTLRIVGTNRDGLNYIGDKFLIISKAQGSTDLINYPQLSCVAPVLDKIYNSCSTLIDKITPYEPIIGAIKIFGCTKSGPPVEFVQALNKLNQIAEAHIHRDQLPNFQLPEIPELGIRLSSDKQQPEPEREIKVKAYLSSPLIRKLNASIAKESRFDKDEMLTLDDHFLLDLHTQIADVEKKIGSTRNFSIADSQVVLLNPGIIKFVNSIAEVYFLSGPSPTTTMFYDKEPLSGRFGDISTIITQLLANGHAKFNKKMAEKRLYDFENSVLVRYGFKLLRLAKSKPNQKAQEQKAKDLINLNLGKVERIALFNQNKSLIEELDKDWDHLEDILYEKNLNRLPASLKIQFIKEAESLDSDSSLFVKEILARTNPFDYVGSHRYDTKGFMQNFANSDDDLKKTILTKLIRLPKQERNLFIFDWLEKNYSDLIKATMEVIKEKTD